MDLERIGVGRLADVYAWNNGLALKLYREPSRDGWVSREAAATEAVTRAGAPAPACHGTVEHHGRPGLLLDRLDGPVMGDVLFAGNLSVVEDLAQLHTEIHACSGSGFPPVRPRLEDRIGAACTPAVAKEVLARLDGLADGSSLLHGDLHVFNVMANASDRWLAIDWDGAFTGPRLYGVARSVFLLRTADMGDGHAANSMNEFRRRAAERYTTTYAGLIDIDLDELSAWRLPVLAARMYEGIQAERRTLEIEIDRELST